MRRVDAYNVSKRRSILSELYQDNAPSTKRCSLLFEDARSKGDSSDIIGLIKECANNKSNGKIYARSLAEIVSEHSDNKSLTTSFLDTIKLYENSTLNDILTSKNISNNIRSVVEEQRDFNIACDTVYENHCSINKEYNLVDYITEMYNPNVNIITDKICSVVDKFNIPVYGKVQTAISEAYYLFSRFNLDFKEKDLINYVAEYFLLANGPYENNMQSRAIVESINNTYLKYVVSEGFSDDKDDSRVSYLCKEFSENGDTSIVALDKFHSDIMNCPKDEVSEDFNKYLNVLFRIILMPDKTEESNHIIRTMIHKIYMDINSGSQEELKTLLVRINWHINKVDNYLNDYEPEETIRRRLEEYSAKLKDTRELLDGDLDTLYTPYNELCIESSEYSAPISLNEYKIFKFDNLITRTYKLDRYIQNKVEPSRQKIFKYVKDKNTEIFGEDASIYEFLTPEGNIDCCIRSYAYDEANVDYNELNSFLTNIIMEANESILNDTDFTCYYELTTDLVEFHIKDFANISLDEDDKIFVENYINKDNEDRMAYILSMGNLINENYDFVNDSIKYFSKDMPVIDRVNRYKEFLECASTIGVDKDIIDGIYYSIRNRLDTYNEQMFRYYAGSIMDRYTPNPGNELAIMEAFCNSQYILELDHDPYSAVNTKNLEKFGYHGEDEKKRGYDDEDERPVRQPQQQDIAPHKEEPREIADDDYEDVEKQGPRARMGRTNAKLVAKGAVQKSREAGAKLDRAFRMSDVVFNHFVKTCKQALVSDRREAIIKGSVIPSFSKCIKIGIVLAALGAVAPTAAVLTAIGGLIASKQLTKRERSLLLDDIEVELQVIDKELQIADANNQINKYRALMKMKKDLQRQYQRIRQNIRLGKDFVPSKTSIDSEA